MDIIGDNFVEIVQVTDISESGAGIYVPHSFSGVDTSKPINAIVTLPGQSSFKTKGSINQERTAGISFWSFPIYLHKERSRYLSTQKV